MSILKGILHHWNKTTKSYDTIHPETEVSQVTDWNNGIVNTLASTALGGLVNTLTSDSLLATMIQKVLTATGVKYNIAQNGYLCFGGLFGGIIIQWGLLAEEQWVYPPLTPPAELLCVVAIHETTSNTTTPLANELGTVRFKIHNEFSSGNDGTNKSRCIIICR